MGLFSNLFNRKPTESSFAEAFIAEAKRRGERRQANYDAAKSQIVFTEGDRDALTVALGNLYLEYCGLPKAERKNWLIQTCDILVPPEIPSDFEEARANLRPTVRPRMVIDTVRFQAEAQGVKILQLPYVDISEHLIACLVYDLPNTMRFVTQEDLDSWGTTVYEAVEAAKQNLDATPPPIRASLGDKVHAYHSGDGYDATRMLSLDMMREIKADGQPLVLPMARDYLLVTGSEDEVGLKVVAELSLKEQGSRPLCAIPHVLEGDEWHPWRPPANHPQAEAFRLFELQHFVGEYTEQKQLLEERNEKLGVEAFVATYTAIKKEGELFSYCDWTKGVYSWLPKTDAVALVDHETQSTTLVPWKSLAAAVGDLMTPLEYCPARWSVTDFPTKEQIDKLPQMSI